MKTNVAVIGAGVIGLSTAYRILETSPDVQMTIFSDQFSPNTTGDVSAGFIYPYLCSESETIERWLRLTVDYLSDLHKLPNSYNIGVAPCFGYILDEKPTKMVNCLPFVETLSKKEAASVLHHNGSGMKLTTWTCHCVKYLPWLMKKIELLGGKFVRRRIESFQELSAFDMIINSSGIEASNLTDDKLLTPIRGQVFVVKAPWVKHFVLKGNNYILPRLDDVVLGGTSQKGDFNLKLDATDRQNIWESCCELNPSIKYSEVVEERVGLRPSRQPVRLEIEEQILNGKQVPILHNYGHGGAGVTLHWGCALDACDMFSDYWLKKKLKHKI